MDDSSSKGSSPKASKAASGSQPIPVNVVRGRSVDEPDIEITHAGSDAIPESVASPTMVSQPAAPAVTPSPGLRGFIRTHHTRILLVAGLLIIAPTAVWAYFAFTKPVQSVSQEVSVPKKPAKPATKASPLTGLEVDPAAAERAVTAVVIENHPDARPQSGLSQAGVVYEGLAEGGITRFLAFFQDEKVKEIGPVRSLRPYFVDWTLEFNAPIAHVGGDADALDLIKPLAVKDMNQFYNGPSFYRSKDRVAPHNAYTSSDLLDQLEQKLGYDAPASFTPSPRQPKDSPASSPAHPNIHINYSYTGFQVDYAYDSGCNCYARSLAGAPHIDRNTGAQIKVKNVVVEYMPTRYGKSRIGEQEVFMGTPGNGKAIVFCDGQAITGTWSKGQHTDRTKLLDDSGKEIPLNKGNTWFSIVPTDKIVSY
jgi:hypothetical protein